MILDLFSGMGGWTADRPELGAVGVEIDGYACATARAAGHAVIRADVRTFPFGHLDLDGLIGSPPCQTFSQAGDRGAHSEMADLVAHVLACADGWRSPPPFTDPRTALVLEPLRYVLAARPRWVALEQVPDVAVVWDAYCSTLRVHGYHAWSGVLNAADYGVPQTRRRAFLMAHRDRVVLPPEPTHCEGGADSLFGRLEAWRSMAEALDLGCGAVNTGKDWKPGGTRADAQTIPLDQPAPTVPAEHGGAGLWWLTRPATTVTTEPQVWPPGHKINADDIARLGEAEARARYGQRGQGGNGAVRLTIEQALVLQSFAADHPMAGPKSAQFAQVGNACPPRVAARILDVLTEGP